MASFEKKHMHGLFPPGGLHCYCCGNQYRKSKNANRRMKHRINRKRRSVDELVIREEISFLRE